MHASSTVLLYVHVIITMLVFHWLLNFQCALNCIFSLTNWLELPVSSFACCNDNDLIAILFLQSILLISVKQAWAVPITEDISHSINQTHNEALGRKSHDTE